MSNLKPIPTSDAMKQAVLDNAFNTCQNDPAYLVNLIEWAYRDYTGGDFQDEYYQVTNEDDQYD